MHPSSGLKCMQDLRVEEMLNGINKASAKKNLMKNIRVAGESSMHSMNSTGREGIARGTV